MIALVKAEVEKPDVSAEEFCSAILTALKVSSWLIKASKEQDSLEKDRMWLEGDAITMIVAGRCSLHDLYINQTQNDYH